MRHRNLIEQVQPTLDISEEDRHPGGCDPADGHRWSDAEALA